MKESIKRNIIDGSSLIATTVGGVLGVVTGIPVIQVVAYLPPIVQFVFLNFFDVDDKTYKGLNKDKKKLILKTCDSTKEQLQNYNRSIAEFFGYACARIEFELAKNFSIENIKDYFSEIIKQEPDFASVYMTEKDLHDLISMFVNTFKMNLLNYSKLADYLSREFWITRIVSENWKNG